MNLDVYVDTVRHQLATAAQAGGEDARALAERLVAPLDAAIRLTIQEALAAAAEEVTCDLAPGSVELRLRGRDVEFVVSAPPPDEPAPGPTDGDAAAGDDGGMLRINLRLPEHLKSRIEQAAGADGLSVNSWLVRAAAGALERTRRQQQRPPHGPNRHTGWAR